MNIIRGVHGDMELDGYILKKGSLAQSPSMIAHLDEGFWGRPGHPASEFWAERFIVEDKVKDESGDLKTVKRFSTDGMAGHWFPYGKFWTTQSAFSFYLYRIRRRLIPEVVNRRWNHNLRRARLCQTGNSYHPRHARGQFRY